MNWPAVSRFTDHWSWQPDWTPSRPRLLWYLTFEDQPDVASAVTPAASALRATGADVVPPEWLHLTVTDVGFADEVDDWSLAESAAAVRNALQDRAVLDLRLGPVMVLPGAVVLAAGPVTPLRLLRSEARRAMRGVGMQPPDDTDGDYWPHVSLCYVNAATCQEHLWQLVRGAETRDVPVRCDKLALVLVTRKDGHYRWQVQDEVALRQPLDERRGAY